VAIISPPRTRGTHSGATASGSTVATTPLPADDVHRWASYRGVVSRWDDGDGVVRLPDGRRVRGRGLRRPAETWEAPDFGVYLLGRDPGPLGWPYDWVRWPDFRLPASTEAAVETLSGAHERAASERVEIACGGGVGRTGTALALLAVMSGVPPDDAVAWVRSHYHPRAVETRRQRRWLTEVAGPQVVGRRPDPRSPSS
jgi:hypothetical protein